MGGRIKNRAPMMTTHGSRLMSSDVQSFFSFL